MRAFWEKLRKRVVFALFLSFCQCQSSSPTWSTETLRGHHTKCDVALYPASCPFRGIDIEIRPHLNNFIVFLKVHSIPLTSSNQVIIVVDNESHQFDAEVLEGGQWLILSDDGKNFLLSALTHRKTATLKIERYLQDVTPNALPQLKKLNFFQVT